MKFSDRLWQTIQPIYGQILYHPFNIELAEGTLEKKRFVFYLEQDAHYLISYSKALAFIAARTDSSEVILQFLNLSLGALVAERELHANFFPENYNWDHVEPSPSCIAYTQHLIAVAATSPLEEAIAAVLPCLWIYREVSRQISAHTKENNPYAQWIETYSSQEFSDATDQAISILDKLAGHCSPKQLDRMQRVFEYSSLFEWHFWNDAYNMTVFHNSIKNLGTEEIQRLSGIGAFC